MNKSNVACNYVEDMDVTFITFDNSICELQPTDQLTIEIDKGEDLSSVESKVEEESAAIQSKIDNIDLSSVAKQGKNQEATNSKILEEVGKIPDLKNIYSARFEQNSDGDNTWTMVMPVVSGVIMNEDDTVTIQM